MQNSKPLPPPPLSDDDDEAGTTRGTWLFIISLVLAKIVIVATIFAVEFSYVSTLYVAVTTWFWFVVGAALLAGPIAYELRVRKVRRRKEELKRSEWMVEDVSTEQFHHTNPRNSAG